MYIKTKIVGPSCMEACVITSPETVFLLFFNFIKGSFGGTSHAAFIDPEPRFDPLALHGRILLDLLTSN